MLSLVQILSVLELGVTPLQKKEYFEHIIIILEMPAQVSHVREQWFKTQLQESENVHFTYEQRFRPE